MDNAIRDGLARSVGLNSLAREAVRELAILCNSHDGLDLPLEWDPDGAGGRDAAPNHLLWYERGELVGLAAIQGSREAEVYGMVHPEHRRRGIGRALLDDARALCRARGELHLIVATEDLSDSGKAFVLAAGGRFRFAEYTLDLDPTAIDRSRPVEQALRLRRATTAEIVTIAEIGAAAFGDPLDQRRAIVERGMAQSHQRYFLATLDDAPVGTLRVSDHPPHVYITAFAVLPDFQGRGYGRQMLLETIDMLLAEGRRQIRIEVETENRGALGLYEACGFRRTTAYLYYAFVCAST